MKSLLAPKNFQVVIPCYNCEDYICKCLESLRRQNFKNWTALVADDCSTDHTADAVSAFMKDDPRIRLRVGKERAWLMGNTLNGLRSLDMAPSDVVAILDGDDWLMEDCLEKVWEAHNKGYDLVYTDEEIEGQNSSIAGPLLSTAPVRRQSWRFSQLRSFKRYLFDLLPDKTFRDREGNYFRAAGDLALYLPMAELTGSEKICFIPEILYHYRVHESCNFKVMRGEQLRNNWDIRNRPCLDRQTIYFDVTEKIRDLKKADLHSLGPLIRSRYPSPYSVNVAHVIHPSESDDWLAYHNLWIEEGVYLSGRFTEEA